MATNYSFSTTDPQDQAINWLVEQYNAGHPGATITAAQYVQVKIQDALRDAIRTFAEGAADYVAKTFPNATDAQKAQILTILQGS